MKSDNEGVMDLNDFDPHYLVTLDEIYHAHWSARKRRRLALMREAVALLWPNGHPTRLIHITGTNGKGSVAHYLSQALGKFGNTGSWTGPHVFDYAERFHLNGKVVDHKQISQIFRQRIQPLQSQIVRNDNSFTFAELGVLLALCLFDQGKADWAVMEVGNGGRYTPLRALPAAACVLTNVGNDHKKTLGEALWQRALEKAGIAQRDVPFFTSAEGEALDYVVRTAESEGAPVRVVGAEDRHRLNKLFPDVRAAHVSINLALALDVVGFFFPDAAQADLLPLMQSRLPARFWHKEPNLVVDVAHNEQKIVQLVEELLLHFPHKPYSFVLGLSRSRKPLEVFAPILAIAHSIVVTSASYAGQNPQQVADELRSQFEKVTAVTDPMNAVRQARAELPESGILVVTGSAYMIDQAFNPNPYLKTSNRSYGRRYRNERS